MASLQQTVDDLSKRMRRIELVLAFAAGANVLGLGGIVKLIFFA